MNTLRRFALLPSVAAFGLLTIVALALTAPTTQGKDPKIKGNNPVHPPIVTVVKNDFDKAKGWRITWKSVAGNDPTPAGKIQSVFSTVTGAVHSVDYLNGAGWKTSDNADMMVYFGDLRSTNKVTGFSHKTAVKKTQFRLTSMKQADLEDVAKHDPNKFSAIFALAFDPAGEVKEDYKKGQIYVFKTDRAPAKYGAVRIVSLSPRIIEVVVQK